MESVFDEIRLRMKEGLLSIECSPARVVTVDVPLHGCSRLWLLVSVSHFSTFLFPLCSDTWLTCLLNPLNYGRRNRFSDAFKARLQDTVSALPSCTLLV